MKTITKNTKRVLSLVIALALLLGSMFISNVGVNFTASADTAEATTLTWHGDVDTTFEGSGTQADPYIISTPAELAGLMKHSQDAWDGTAHTTATTGEFYKVAPNLIFDMCGKSWSGYNGTNFAGTFDGNGLIVTNLKGSAAKMGLFPSVEGPATIKNVTVKDCEFSSTASDSGGIGGIFGAHNNWLRTDDVTVENCAVINCTIKNTSSKDGSRAGLIGGAQNYGPVVIKNCYTVNNTISAQDTSLANCGFLPSRGGSASLTVSNSIAIGNSPYPNVSGHGTFTNVYTNIPNSAYTGTGITTTVSTGADALTDMNLSTVYWMATSSYPVLRGAHKFKATDHGNGTHTVTGCYCCSSEIAGLAEDHYYDLDNIVNGKASCICGAFKEGVSKPWNGTADSDWDGAGTKESPYIIKTPEQLYAMVQSQGFKQDANGKPVLDDNGDPIPLYFRVSNNVDTLYLNDTINYDTLDEFKAAVSTMTDTNWSKDLKQSNARCTLGDACPAKAASGGTISADTYPNGRDIHTLAYDYTFVGHFDGNGVTIKGLYSVTTGGAVWAPGTGFFPGMTKNASISNTVFDMSYVKNAQGNAAVITSSVAGGNKAAYWDTPIRCDDVYIVTEGDDINDMPSPTIMNVVVKNAYVATENNAWKDAGTTSAYTSMGYAAGFVSYTYGANFKMNNCLFDGIKSEFNIPATVTRKKGDKNEEIKITPYYAGFLSGSSHVNNSTEFLSCVSVGDYNIMYTTDEATNTDTVNGEKVDIKPVKNSYTVGTALNHTYGTIFVNEESYEAMPLLNWAAWDADTIMPKFSSDGFDFKEYKYYKNNFKNSEYYDSNPVGSYGDGNSDDGFFFKYNTLEGSGTSDDPYLIDNADTLFQIIAAGGMHRGTPQHFKLICDIDIGGTQWVTDKQHIETEDYNKFIDPTTGETTIYTYYDYRAFKGVLDGDNYTVTGLYSATDDTTAGLIPTLDGGTVTNLHLRNGYVYSSAADAQVGLIAGYVINGGKITNCTIADSVTNKFTADDTQTAVTDNNNINFVASPVKMTADLMATQGNDKVYYGIIGDDHNAQLISRALKMPCADINGDGIGEEYAPDDLTALAGKLLRQDGYQYVYGDANRDNKIDIRDLAFVKREMAQDKFTKYDGFWRYFKGGNVKIYFSDNDDYDAARKLELFLESQITGLDVQKFGLENSVTMVNVPKVAAIPQNDAIVIKSGNSTTTGNYTINYDAANVMLTIEGDNYTAAYEAVLKFIAESDAAEGKFCKEATGKIADGTTTENKMPIDVDTTIDVDSTSKTSAKYLYAWGDEFTTGTTIDDNTTTVSYDTWLIRDKGGDATVNAIGGYGENYRAEDIMYNNLKLGSDEMLPILNVVKDGKLYMHRGVENYREWENAFGSQLGGSTTYASNTRNDKGVKTDFDANDMASGGILQTKNSFLYNKGYAEFKASVPNDIHAFPAWWIYTTPGYNNRDIDLGLYSKVLPINERYDNISNNFTGDSVESYKYKVPSFFVEIDAMEIVNKGKIVGANQSSFHKWYNLGATATTGPNQAFKIYDLDWDSVLGNEAQFTASAPIAEIKADYSIVSSPNADFNTRKAGNRSLSVSLGHFDYADGYATASDNLNNVAANGEERIYGFLWEDDLIKFYIYSADRTLLWSTTVQKSATESGEGTFVKGTGLFGQDSGQKGYVIDNADGYTGKTTFGQQYAHMLIDNHIFPFKTTSWWDSGIKSGYQPTEVINDAVMTVDYVRVYQLDGAKNIITSDTEAFNNNNRLGK